MNTTDSIAAADASAPAVDALIVGAGPVGLFAAFQFGLLGMRCAVVDALPFAGGQTVQLYADKPIYDIPGIPVCLGRELTDLLLTQIKPFGTQLHLGLQVASLAADQGRYQLGTTRSHSPSQSGPTFDTRFICITAGVGAFVPRPLPGLGTEALAPHEGHGVHWALDPNQPTPAGPHVIAGGGPEAVQAALHLAKQATAQMPITIVHRRDVLQADEADLNALAALRDSGRVQVLAGQIAALNGEPGALQSLSLAMPNGQTHTLPAAQLWVLQGISPRLGPLADWGMALAKRQIAVDTGTLATSLPGVFAAGDVVSYPGKRRLIVSGFHEATQAAYAASDLLLGGDTPVQYTTTSPALQQRLGVSKAP